MEKHKANLITGGVAVALGMVTKKLLKYDTVNTAGIEHILASFGVVAGAAIATDYIMLDMRKGDRG